MGEGELPAGLEIYGVREHQSGGGIQGSGRQKSGIFPLVSLLAQSLMACLALSADCTKFTGRKGESYCCSSTSRKAGRKARFSPPRASWR